MTTAGWNHSQNADGPGNDPFHKNFSFEAQALDAGDDWLFTGLRRAAFYTGAVTGSKIAENLVTVDNWLHAGLLLSMVL